MTYEDKTIGILLVVLFILSSMWFPIIFGHSAGFVGFVVCALFSFFGTVLVYRLQLWFDRPVLLLNDEDWVIR